jgi:2',3'-cyclic-nucleotide 2'-phosphodiesterase (5'-nucleotidase family)
MDKPRIRPVFWLLAVLVWLAGCVPGEESRTVDGRLVLLDSVNAPFPDPAIDSVIEIYRADLEAEMNQVLAYSAQPMRRGTPEGLLNNFVADLVFDLARELYEPEDGIPIDFCLLNYGGLRTSLPEGPLTRGRVFELMPFENEMVVLTLTAEKTRELFDYLARSTVGMPVAGITLGIREQEVEHVEIQGESFDEDRNYKIITSDYLAGGGDNMTFFLEPLSYEYIGMKIRDAIILHLKRQHEAGQPVSATLDGRMYYVE